MSLVSKFRAPARGEGLPPGPQRRVLYMIRYLDSRGAVVTAYRARRREADELAERIASRGGAAGVYASHPEWVLLERKG